MVNKPQTVGHLLCNPQTVVPPLANCERQYLKVAMEIGGAGLSLASPICLLAHGEVIKVSASKEKKVSQLLRYRQFVEKEAVPYPTAQKSSFPYHFPIVNGEPHLASNTASATIRSKRWQLSFFTCDLGTVAAIPNSVDSYEHT